jgi:hypothetical protein
MEINMIESLFASRTRNSLRNIVSPRYMDHAFSQLKIYYQEKGFNTNDSLHSHKSQELLRDSKRE